MSTLAERGRCSCAASAKDVLSKPMDRGGLTPVIVKELGLVTASANTDLNSTFLC